MFYAVLSIVVLQSTERAKEDIKAALQALNTHLLPKTYLVGERITLADIGVACTLLQLYQYVLDPSFRYDNESVTVTNYEYEYRTVLSSQEMFLLNIEFKNLKYLDYI